MLGNFIRITITNKQIRCLLLEEIDNKQIYKQEDVGGSLSREGDQGTPVYEVTFELRTARRSNSGFRSCRVAYIYIESF